MPLTHKEKELANIGASVATGCKPCTDYHFNKVREAGASDEEIKQAMADAMAVRDTAREIMESHSLKHLGMAKAGDVRPHDEETTRIKELVSVASAFAVNCTTSVKKHVAAAKTIGVTEEEIESVLEAALFIKGEAAHYVGQIVKLKEEKDRLQQLLEELERGIVHEINTPIGTINSTADTLSRSVTHIVEELERSKSLDSVKDNRQFQNSMRAIRDGHPITLAASERITRIVGSLKAFAHLDEAAHQQADLHEGLENTLTLLEHDFRDKIRVVREYGEIPKVTCNPGEINQVFMNLLANAAEAIKDKGAITIQTFEKDGNVHIQVSDTGNGISPRRRERLFDPVFAKKGSRMKAGLGLFTSANIVQKHRGQIDVESEVGKGSTFTVVLPIRDVRPAETADPAQQADRCDRLE
jgi:AhpD family alkylhydroperoxidase